MTRRLPILATLVVLGAAATMIALGIWQLQRKAEKEALLARYARAVTMNSDVRWPLAPEDYPRALYRHTRVDCARVDGMEAVAGRSLSGRAGWAHQARCRLPDGSTAMVALGWSDKPAPPAWNGGEVGGVIGAAGNGIRLIAAPAQGGLEPLAAPDPASIPNNHLSYAIQWFFFAATALLIYGLALRKRWRGH